MKKTILFGLLCVVLMLCAMVFDYLYNERFHKVALHTVALTDIQNKMEFSAPITKEENLYLMKGAVKKIDNITVGANVTVSFGGETLEGYLYQLEPAMDDIYMATVSVITKKPLTGEATAVIYGTRELNQMLIPASCLVTDEKGEDAVFLEMNGYAVLRRVEVG